MPKIKQTKEDKIWAEIVRRKGYCMNCKRTDRVLNAHHIMPRSRWATRLDVENGLCICAWCHTLGDESVHRGPEGSRQFCIRLIGAKKYKELEKRSLQYKSKAQAIKEFNEKLQTMS